MAGALNMPSARFRKLLQLRCDIVSGTNVFFVTGTRQSLGTTVCSGLSLRSSVNPSTQALRVVTESHFLKGDASSALSWLTPGVSLL